MSQPTLPQPEKPASSRQRRSQARTRARSHSGAKDSEHSLWLRPWRRLVAFWNYWKPTKLLSGGVNRSTHIIHSMLSGKGAEFALEQDDGLYLVRTWPSKKTLWNPLWWINSAISCARRWLVTRHFLPLMLAIPAAVVALTLFGAISAGNRIAPGTGAIVYKRMLAGGPLNVDPKQAKLALDALLRMDPDNAAIIYDRACLEQVTGDIDVARQIMGELATSAKSETAALWLANDVGDAREFSTWPKQKMLIYHNWLQVAVENNPENPGPRRMLGDLRALVGNKKGAYEALLPIADIDTNTSYLVYFLQRDLGFVDEAEVRGEKLMRSLRSRLQEAPSDHGARVQLGLLLASREQFAEAKEQIQKGLDIGSSAGAQLGLRRAKSDVLLSESESIARTDQTPAGLLTRMSLLLDAFKADASNSKLNEAIAQACFESADSEDEQLSSLREAIVQNVDNDTAHFILGTIALNKGNIQEATQHLELAAKQNPNMPGLLNNLAYALCNSQQPDLSRALQLSNTANSLQPNHPYLRETRGQIYLKLQKYTEAIVDLEVALNAEELRPTVRESLAQAYAALGQTEIAQRHRELASQGR